MSIRTENATTRRPLTIDLEHLEHQIANVHARIEQESTGNRAIVHFETETDARRVAAEAIVYGWATLVEIVTGGDVAAPALRDGFIAGVILTA